ncbi:hypothetical protein [Streptomyces sp. enrichment culture]|uniref:hypothetical protein n=1 Tax=Streptomyces sp. enrichment culture TaxID=1795815 RepID=UPI003F56E17C
MAEQHDADADRGESVDGPGGPQDGPAPKPSDGGGGGGARIDEEAAWAAIVAAYGEEPPDPPGARPYRPVRDLALPDDDGVGGTGGGVGGTDGVDGSRRAGGGAEGGDGRGGDGGGPGGDGRGGASDGGREGEGDGPAAGGGEPLKKPALGGSVVFAPGVGPGPRDYRLADPDDEAPAARTGRRGADGDGDDDGEGHFVPPEPPPLPEADPAAKFGWLGVIGGPVLMLVAVLLQWEMTWWLTTLCVGGFLGGFATLVARMRSGDDEDDDDPGRGAVV